VRASARDACAAPVPAATTRPHCQCSSWSCVCCFSSCWHRAERAARFYLLTRWAFTAPCTHLLSCHFVFVVVVVVAVFARSFRCNGVCI